MKQVVLLALIGPSLSPLAWADTIDRFGLGVMAHNIELFDDKNANKEPGEAVSAELRFASPGFLDIIGSPHPYVMVSIATEGDTSYLATGLEYELDLSRDWQMQLGFGYALHTGHIKTKGETALEREQYGSTRLLLGSRDLFRTHIAVSRQVSDAFGIQLIVEHLSHGQILGNGRNQGLDNVGLRAVWRGN